jgi:methionine-rich copper-binding protein CopC
MMNLIQFFRRWWGPSAGAALKARFARPFLEALEDRLAPSVNPIVAENQLPGTPESVWLVSGVGDPTLQGYSTDISVNHGQTVQFKITDTSLAPYHIDIYRVGYYQGDGARFITTINPSQTQDLVRNQPAPLTNATTGLIDAGNWSVSASWNVPTTAVSGVYLARLVRNDTGGASLITFIVRADDSHSDLLFQTSDATWQAYNTWGGNSVYGTNGDLDERAFEVSYNRPLNDAATSGGLGDYNSFFYAEYPMVRWLEANGYDVSYFTDVDTDRNGGLIQNHKVFLSVGHDEYWSGNMRANVEQALTTGVNLAFFSGNEVYWKTEYAPSTDGSNTPDRTMITYKDSLANQPINPDHVWTGLWADARFSPPEDGGLPANALTGTQPLVNRGPEDEGVSMTVSSAYSSLRFWRNTAVANLQPGQSLTLGPGDAILGYEWDSDLDNGFRPAGLFDLNMDTVAVPQELYGYQSEIAPGTVTHSLTLYRASSGAFVFGAGTVQWSWGLDGDHDGGDSTPDPNMQQATVNLFADMHAQPGSLQAGLVAAAASTDFTPPTTVVTNLTAGESVHSGTPVTITGTATDAGGGVVAVVEVSTDGGETWHRATGQAHWTYTWTPGATGPVTVLTRAADDSGNIETPSTGVSVNVLLPTGSVSIWGPTAVPQTPSTTDTSPTEVGVKFQTEISGYITGIRFYKGSANTGTHVGHLWDSNGNLLASATFTNETATGWQEVTFATPVAVTAGQTYLASYYAPKGGYAADVGYFMFQPTTNGPLVALSDAAASGGQGVYSYGLGGGFPTSSFGATNYWVDVVFFAPPETTPPTVVSETPAQASGGVPIGAQVKATFSDRVLSNTINFTLRDANNNLVAATLSYDAASETAVLTPNAPLAGFATYTATVSGVKDLSGNAMTAPVSWTFTTGSATAPPVVVAMTPVGGATSVASATTVSVTFNEGVQSNTISFILNDGNGVVVPGTTGYDANNLTATFTPGAALNTLSTYTATVSGATDAAGNVMAPLSWQFQTAPAQYTLWNATATPAVASAADPSAVEVGVKFMTDVAGTISGVRFYKGAGNTGTHVAHLWDAFGDPLASATYTGESSAGWQSVAFSAPVVIDPNTTYIVSYFAPNGGYSYNSAYFASSGVNSGPLHALSNAAGGGDGVFFYGVGGFPTASYNATNYWVDPVFNAIPDTTPPTVVSQSPVPNATAVSNNTAVVTATFSESVQPGTITFVLKDANNNVVPGTLTYDARSRTATLSPNALLAGFTTYTATLSGAVDLSGNVMAPASWSFTTGKPAYSFWNAGATPAVASVNDPNPVELGVRFTTDTPGVVTGIRFYKGPANTGTHVGRLWTASGTLLATVTFTNETASGWQQANFSSPVAINAGATYVISYFAPNGGYADTPSFFASAGVNAGPLHALADGVNGGNGVYRYAANGGFPNASYNSSNYWVDIVFSSTGVIPTVTTESPTPQAAGVAAGATVTATFNEAVQAGSIVFTLQDSSGNAVAASVSYNSATFTAVLTPSAPLAANAVYTASISATDNSGTPMTAPFTWSFTTAGVWVQTTAADFAAGTVNGTTVTSAGGGAVQLASNFSDDFNGTSLNGSAWTTAVWNSGGGATVAGSVASVSGAEILSTQTFVGIPVEANMAFAAAPWQHFGLATDFAAVAGNYWAIFSTMGTTNTLFARVNINGATQDVSLGALPSGFHVYRVEPVAGVFSFYIDGVLKATLNGAAPSGTALKIAFSSYLTGQALQVDWVRQMGGTFSSSVLNAGGVVTWGAVNWTASVPAGTQLIVLTRTGNTATPDGTWSNWAVDTNGGTVASPAGRYLQYMVIFITTDPSSTPALNDPLATPVFNDITFNWS